MWIIAFDDVSKEPKFASHLSVCAQQTMEREVTYGFMTIPNNVASLLVMILMVARKCE